MTMQRRTKADKHQTAATSAKASKKSSLSLSYSYAAKSSKTKSAKTNSLSYGTIDDDPLIFVDDDFEPSSDSTDDDPLIFVDDDFEPNVSTDTTDDDPLIFVDDDVKLASSSDLTASTGGGNIYMLNENSLSMDDLLPPSSTTHLKLPGADSSTAAIKAKESLSQPPQLPDDNTNVTSSNFGVIGVAVVAVGLILFTVVRARHRYFHRQLLLLRHGEVGTDLEDDASDVSSV